MLYVGRCLVFSEDEFKANFQVPPKTQICKSLQFVSNLSQSWPIRCQTSAKQSSTNPMHSHSYANLVQIHRKNLLLVDCQSTAIHSDLPSINVNPAKSSFTVQILNTKAICQLHTSNGLAQDWPRIGMHWQISCQS